MVDLSELARQLQQEIAIAEMRSPASRRGEQSLGFLVMKKKDLKLKIYQEPTHDRPHIHVDIGKSHHDCSFAIDPVELLAGYLTKEQMKTVIAFIERNREVLLKMWADLKAGGDGTELVAEISA